MLTTVYLYKIFDTPVLPYEFNPLKFTHLNWIELNKIQCSKNPMAIKQRLYGALLTRLLISYHLGIKNLSDILISYDKFGKPYCVNLKLSFNVSYCDQYIVIAVSDSNIGVDIEIHKSVDFNISNIFMSEYEMRVVKKLENLTDATRYFFDIWTAKESFIKWIGKGFLYPVKSITFDNDSKMYNESHCCFNVNLKKIEILSGLSLVVCFESDTIDIKLINFL